MKKIDKSFAKMIRIGIKGSLEKQDKIFQANSRNRKLLKKAQSLAKY